MSEDAAKSEALAVRIAVGPRTFHSNLEVSDRNLFRVLFGGEVLLRYRLLLPRLHWMRRKFVL